MEEHFSTYGYYDDLDDDRDCGNPVQDQDLVNMSDDQYLKRILGPRRMGFELKQNLTTHYLIQIVSDCGPHDPGVRDHILDRDGGQHGRLPGDCEAQVHAHGYQLLLVFPGSG